MVAAQVRTAPAFEVSALRALFDASGFAIDDYHHSYEVLPGGRAFVFLRPRQSVQTATGPPVVQVENWFASLRSRLRQ